MSRHDAMPMTPDGEEPVEVGKPKRKRKPAEFSEFDEQTGATPYDSTVAWPDCACGGSGLVQVNAGALVPCRCREDG